jgi:hypothetical protein
MMRAARPTSTPSRIARRIKRASDDAVFSVSDFLDLDTRNAVDAALSWLTRKGTLRRLARGLYYRPRTNPYLGEIIPPKEAVVPSPEKRVEALFVDF